LFHITEKKAFTYNMTDKKKERKFICIVIIVFH